MRIPWVPTGAKMLHTFRQELLRPRSVIERIVLFSQATLNSSDKFFPDVFESSSGVESNEWCSFHAQVSGMLEAPSFTRIETSLSNFHQFRSEFI